MKNQLFYLLIILGMALGFTSCASDDILNPYLDSDIIHIDVEIPSGELRTRSYGDGSAVSVLKCYVYSVGAEIPMRTENVAITSTDGKRGGSLGIDLPSGGVYDFVFLATSCPQDDKNSKVYYNPSDRTLNLNYSKIVGNDEDVDCFFGVLPSISIDKGQSHSVTLKRPFAQLNIGTKDLEVYNKMASAPLATVGVSVDGVYTSMNVMDGNCVGNPTKVTLAPAAIPAGQTFPVKDVSYLAMDYLLVNERKDVTVSLTGSNGIASFTSYYDDIPLQRNYQTVLYGNLLTAEKDFKVVINPEFAGSSNKDVDDPWGDYDLVLKVSEDPVLADYIAFHYYSKTGSHTVQLNRYIDSNYYIKLTWEELNITEASRITFVSDVSTHSNGLTEFIKCDINKLGVTDISNILENSWNLINVEAVKSWDTSRITDMSYMFHNCKKLTTLDISNFNTSNVMNMSYMFSGCNELQILELSNFDTSKVTDMSYMFENCQNIQNLYLTNFDTTKVTDMNHMFGDCRKIQSLDISNFQTSKVTNMRFMFGRCYELASIDVSNFKTSEVTDMSYMFINCSKLKSLDVSNFDTSKVKTLRSFLGYCQQIITIDLSGFNTTNVADMNGMFMDCKKLEKLDVSNFDTSNVIDMANMFRSCTELEKLDVSNFDTSNVTDMTSMFQGLHNLHDLNISNFNTSKVRDMHYMFDSCIKLTTLDISHFDTSEVRDMRDMFHNCIELHTLDVSSFDTSKATDMSGMFNNCSALRSLNLSNFNTSKVTDMNHMFQDCHTLNALNLLNFNTDFVKNMSNMFFACRSLLSLDLSSFNTSNTTNMSGMFDECPAEVIWGPNGGLH